MSAPCNRSGVIAGSRRRAGALVVVVAALTVAGCSGGSAGPAAGPGSPTPSPLPSGVNESLARLVLSSGSASLAGLPVQRTPAPEGTALRGKNAYTLDLCNARFSSESKRTARDQVDYGDSQAGAEIASEEVVRYSAGGAVAAYHEVVRAARTCPSSVKEGSATVTHVSVQPRSSALAASQLTVTQRVTRGRQNLWTAAIYQYDGDIYAGVYTYLPTRAEALRYAEDLADRVAKRLTASVGTPV
jgi:hypothetical protein